jgi:thiosulfate/3-mercaptopyruvate sulfurtransferase
VNLAPLISAIELAGIIDQCVVIDVRHDLLKPALGRQAYDEAHLPGAFFLSQDTDLAGAKTGKNGRHPLPERDQLAARLAQCGLSIGQKLIAYDAQGGMYAARLWWLARWLGHPQVAVLDGGIAAWQRAGFPVAAAGVSNKPAGNFTAGASLVQTVSADDLMHTLGHGGSLPVDGSSQGDGPLQVIDARAGDRYRGEVEPMDPVAGHIPGALNRPFALNLRPDGLFKPAEVLRQEFEGLLGSRSPQTVVNQCGSGVTACHNILAMEYAGLSGSALYPGSWSEWCADAARPVATGA